MIKTFVAIVTLILILPSLGFAFGSNSSLQIDMILKPTQYPTVFNMPVDDVSKTLTNFTLSDGSKICPSNHCTMIFNSLIPTVFIGDTLVGMTANFRLQDNITNGHFSPKKQALVEDMDMFFSCSPYDLKEDVEKGKTDYYCKDTNSFYFTRSFNNTNYYYYAPVVTFESPTNHLVVHAEEK